MKKLEKIRNMARIVFLSLFVFVFSCGNRERTQSSKHCCNQLSDNYNRKLVLDMFSKALNLLVPDYKGPRQKGFYINENCHLIGSFIYDLTDTLNEEDSLDECIEFKEDHVYHFAPMRKSISYSNIAILQDGNVKIFRAI
ncbi:MAG: hypothetical protein ACK5BJ_10710, partial [Bacteroidota bacterium]